MSADNWGLCPKCKKELDESLEREGANEEVARSQIKKFQAKPQLREDYEIFVSDDGTFSVRYSCLCHNCGFSFKYSHIEEVPMNS